MNARELLEAATPRPWHQTGYAFRIHRDDVEPAIGTAYSEADCALIVQSVNEREALLDIAEAADRYRAELREFQARRGLFINPSSNSWQGELLDGLARLDGIRGQQ